MALTGISRTDQLFEGQSLEPIGPGDLEQEAVGIIQDQSTAFG
jgi:hypothetical protein